jgi:hypothetical protein
MITEYSIIFNNILNNSYFPKEWKKGKTILLKKPDKDQFDPKSFRPVSMMPNISKVFEKIVNYHIINISKNKNILPENQFGFRSKHSTAHAISKLVSDVCWFLNSKQYVGACLIDFESAFNSVWTKGLIFKLMKYDFPKYLIKLILSMISEKSFVTCIEDTHSDTVFEIQNGLQQGTVNSPILFSIFISDLLDKFNSSQRKTFSLAFADDLICYTSGKKQPKFKQNSKICLTK